MAAAEAGALRLEVGDRVGPGHLFPVIPEGHEGVRELFVERGFAAGALQPPGPG